VSKKLRLIVSVALLGWLAWRTNWVQVGEVFAHMRLELWLAGLVLYLLTQCVSVVRWRLLAKPLGCRASLPRFAAFYLIGMYFNLFLPTSVGGDVVRAWYLDRGSGQRLPAFLSVFVDRVSGLLVLIALACVAAVCCPVPLERWVAAGVGATAGAAVLGLASLPLLVRWTRGRPSAPAALRARLHALACKLVDAFTLLLTRPRLLLVTTALSLVVQAANVVLVWLLGLAIGAPVPASYYWILVPMVTVLTLLPVSLNGMGVREGGMVLFLRPLGLDDATALSLAFLWFAVFTAASLCGGSVYLFGSFPRPAGRTHDESVGSDPDQGRTGQLKAAA
jgi:uncharacterized protein (TIRG00374 family)